jgi:cytochrome b561
MSAHIVHWLLYALIVVVPVLGWINASWRGFPIVMFGLEFPKLVATRAPGWDGRVTSTGFSPTV